MDDVEIRAAILADEPVIYQFICALEETTLNWFTFQTIFEQNLRNPSIYYLVAERAGEVIGFISCHVQSLLHHTGNVGEVQELFVRNDIRNQRVGQQLLDAVKALSAREKWSSLEVTTNQKRVDTIRFYERESFKQTHVKLVNGV